MKSHCNTPMQLMDVPDWIDMDAEQKAWKESGGMASGVNFCEWLVNKCGAAHSTPNEGQQPR